MTIPSPDQLDPDWHRYPDTVLNFRTTPAVRVDLREPIGQESIRAVTGIGLPGAFAVLTAQNPRGENAEDSVNEQLARQLDETLVSTGFAFLHVDACSPDGAHCEDSVAVAMDREAATRLARELEQVAIFWFDGEKFWIVGALVGGDPVMLPRPV